VRIFTTAGPVFSTMSAKSGRLISAPAGAACAALNGIKAELQSSADKHKVVKRKVVFIGSFIFLKFGCNRGIPYCMICVIYIISEMWLRC
jgi:hypothetical protein